MMHATVCVCGNFDCPADTGGFYVTCRDAGRHAMLLGPYRTHEAALASVEVAEVLANRADAWSHFYAFGTARVKDSSAAIPAVFQPCPACGEFKHYKATCACDKEQS